MKPKRTSVNYRKIAEEYYGVSVAGMHVHHKDGNCNNNDPENLIICTPQQHAEFHKQMGQFGIAALLESQFAEVNWFSIIGKLGAERSKNIPKTKYNMTDVALLQRELARGHKGDPSKTKLCLTGENRTEKQKLGKIKSVETKKKRGMTLNEKVQLNDFQRKGVEAAKLASTGSKKFIHPVKNCIKFAKPNTEKWFNLLDEGYVTN